jgi:hypothetical protein
LSLNTATHPEHQGKWLFTTSAEKTYEVGKQAGYSFVVGVASANSTHGFVTKLGFQLVRGLDARVGCGAAAKASQGIGRDFERIWTPELVEWRIKNPSVRHAVIPKKRGCEILARAGRLGIHAILGTFNQSTCAKALLPDNSPIMVRLASRPWIGRQHYLVKVTVHSGS